MVDKEKVKFSIKYGSIIIGFLLCVFSFTGLFFSIFNPKSFILQIYSFTFGVLIVFGELGWYKSLFGFLNTYFGRGLFKIFVGFSIVFQDWSDGFLSKILGFICLLFGIVQLVFSCEMVKKEQTLEDEENHVGDNQIIDINNDADINKVYDEGL